MLDLVQEQVSRELLRFAVSQAMFCPLCEAVLDVSTSVLLSHGERHAIACVPCFGRAPMLGKFAAVEVLDGRLLFPASKSRAKRIAVQRQGR